MRDARCLMQRPHARPVAGTRRQAEIHPFRFFTDFNAFNQDRTP